MRKHKSYEESLKDLGVGAKRNFKFDWLWLDERLKVVCLAGLIVGGTIYFGVIAPMQEQQKAFECLGFEPVGSLSKAISIPILAAFGKRWRIVCKSIVYPHQVDIGWLLIWNLRLKTVFFVRYAACFYNLSAVHGNPPINRFLLKGSCQRLGNRCQLAIAPIGRFQMKTAAR